MYLIKRSVHSAFLLLLVAPAFAQVKIAPSRFDFGVVRPGETYSFKAKITNVSGKPVTLSDPILSSGHGTASVDKKALKPKETTGLTVHYSPIEGLRGPQNFNVLFTITCAGKKGEVL